MNPAIAKLHGAALLGGALLWSAGCNTPSRANIDLRKQNQELHSQLGEARQENLANLAVIRGLRERQGTLQTLPNDRLNQLFTTHGIEFGRLTGGADLDPAKPGDEGFIAYVVPLDETGDKLKAAGTFDVEAFDLAQPQSPSLGHWHFDVPQAREAWNGHLLQYGYVLTCPWQKVPPHADVTIKATFLDALTQTPFTAQRVIHVILPPQTQPVSSVLDQGH